MTWSENENKGVCVWGESGSFLLTVIPKGGTAGAQMAEKGERGRKGLANTSPHIS